MSSEFRSAVAGLAPRNQWRLRMLYFGYSQNSIVVATIASEIPQAARRQHGPRIGRDNPGEQGLHPVPLVGTRLRQPHPLGEGARSLVLGRRRQQVARFLLAAHQPQHRSPASQGDRRHQAAGWTSCVSPARLRHRAPRSVGQEAGRGHGAGEGLLHQRRHRVQRDRDEDRPHLHGPAQDHHPAIAPTTATRWVP